MAVTSDGASHRHSGLLSIHTTDFRLWSSGTGAPATLSSGSGSDSSPAVSSASPAPSGDGGGGNYIVYTLEVAVAMGDRPSPSTEKVHKRWSQIEQLHGELTHEFPALLAAGSSGGRGGALAFPKQWRKTLEEREIERRLASLNEYFSQLLRRCEEARIKLSVSVAFANFMADTDVPERTCRRGPRLSREQIEAAQKQLEADAEEAAASQRLAKTACERIVRADVVRAQEAGSSYAAFQQQFRPEGGHQSLQQVWEEVKADRTKRGSSNSEWGNFDASATAISAVSMDARLVPLPKRVVVSCYVNDLLEVDLVNEVWRPTLSFTLDWTDDGAIERDGEKWQLKCDEDEIWRPFMDFENVVGREDALNDTVGVYTQKSRPLITQFRRHSNQLRPRYMDLSAFPFDELELDCVCSFAWNASEVELVPGPLQTASEVKSHSEYLFLGASWVTERRSYEYLKRYDDSAVYPQLVLTLRLQRRPHYYLLRVAFSLFLITGFEICSFFLEPGALGERFGVTGTVVLAVVGVQYVAAENLPRIAYLTRMDIWICILFVALWLSFCENLCVYLWEGCRAPASSWLRPALFASFIVVATIWFIWPLWHYNRRERQLRHSTKKEKME